MKPYPFQWLTVPCWVILFLLFSGPANGQVSFANTGGVNEVEIIRGDKRLAVNRGKGEIDLLLITHNRRDVIEAARASAGPETTIYAPERSRELMEKAEDHWQAWWTERFDYYGQQVTKIPTRNLSANRYLLDGDSFEWEGIQFRFIELPGFTRDSGGYVAEYPDGEKEIFTGELILAGGKVPDLYSFQNEIRSARIGNYHGHLGRLSAWLTSLEKLKAEAPSRILPARGAVIEDPLPTIERAMERARAIYRNYISTNALHWYFGEERMGEAANLVLGEQVEGMPLAEHVDLPEWCHHIGTTKLLISESGRGFILDVGGNRQLESLFKYLDTDLVKGYDGIFVTHTHNDHSAFVIDAQREFGCPVYSVAEVSEVMARPGDWFLPGLPNKPIEGILSKNDGATMQWEEFTFTFRFFPGQMFNHAALLVEREGSDPVFFIGDSFSPSGIDDYCLMNRNLLHDDSGYFRCFDIVSQLPKDSWLVNQHINHRFRFTGEELGFLRSSYLERRELIAGFVPWDDPNFSVDEQWAWFHPYGQQSGPEAEVEVELKLTNHSPGPREFQVTVHGSEHLKPEQAEASLSLEGRGQGSLKFRFRVAPGVSPGTQVYTASIRTGDAVLDHWIEGLVNVE